MALLEGHGDVTMDRAGEGHVPSAERFGRVLRERRKQQAPLVAAGAEAARARGQAQPVRAGRAVHRRHRGRLGGRGPSTAAGRAPTGCRRSTRSGGPSAWLARVGGCPSWSSDVAGRGRWPTTLLARCTVPAGRRRRAVDLRRVGRRRLAGAAGAGRAPPAARCTAVHVDHGLRAGLGRRGRRRAGRRGRGFGAGVPGRAGGGGARARTSRPGPAPPATPCSRPTCSPATPPTTRPRRCCSTCCAAPGSTAWPACGPPATRCSALRRAETAALCAALGLTPVDDPSNARPGAPPQPGPPRAAARCSTTSPSATSPRSSPARPSAAPRRRRPARRARRRARPHRRPRRWRPRRRRWPAAPCAAGWPLTWAVTRPTPTPWSGCWPWRRASARRARSSSGVRVERHQQRLTVSNARLT